MKLALIFVVILVTKSLVVQSRITTTTPLPGFVGVSNGSPTNDNAGTVSYSLDCFIIHIIFPHVIKRSRPSGNFDLKWPG